MKKLLFAKFITALIFLSILGFTMISVVGTSFAETHVETAYSEHLYRETSKIAEQLAVKYFQKTDTPSKFYDSLCSSIYEREELWLINPNGEILINTSKKFITDNFPKLNHFNPVQSNGSYYQIGRFFDYFKEDQLSVMVPVTINMQVKGYIAMHVPMTVLYEQRDALLNTIYILFLLFLGIMLIMIPVFYFMINRPLKKIIQGANIFASGDLKYTIPLDKEDELGYLAMTLNYMSDELEMTESYQRKFISNVSHDFRSPLTSIKGYTEAILDGTIPPEMQEKYLKIVVYETDRLYNLTQSMLTLNNLDKKGRTLNYSNFDINHIIKTTAETFEGTCRKKRISIELFLTGQTLFVHADMEQIQQVLYNLIDNAIKFSFPDSIIKIESTLKYETVFISIKDSGCGIPKESLTKIWDRFYKIDASRGKDKTGTGLGLAIVKEIINSHKQNINVISTENVGTEFIFTLQKSQTKN